MKIEGYQLIKPIGEGGMSQVYLAKQESLQREVAIKFLSEQLLYHNTAKELFEKEPLIVARLNHPKIIHVIDKGISEEGKPYFIMEYVRGITLHDLVQTQKVTLSQKVQYIIQLCRGLAYAHRNGIVHRDIKPANIIIDEENNARILDFGIASFYTDDRFADKETHQVMGTDRYMAPEVKISSANANLLSDIYSLGVLMYEVFNGDFVNQPTQDRIENQDIPKAIKTLILQAVAKEPSNRPTSAQVIENKLLHMLKGAHLALSQKQQADQDIATISKNFTLLEVLKSSQYSSVFLYEKNSSHDLIIIKKNNQNGEGLKEAKLLANLKHPNIVNIFGTASNPRTSIVVMEYMSGGTLNDRLMQALDFDRFYPLAKAILDALGFAHRNRIIHGNLRPSNILFDNDEVLKISDFGYSEHYYHNDDLDNWYSPQKIEPAAIELDIFSMGAIFYHMLVGEPISWQNGEVEQTKSFKQLKSPLQDFLLGMLASQPNSRYQTVAQVNTMLEALKDNRGEKSNLIKKVIRRDKRQYERSVVSKILSLSNTLFWLSMVAIGIFYLQAYFFFPELKEFLHKELRELLLLLVSKL